MNDTLDEVLEAEPFKLYSSGQMLGATFIGGPLATGILMKENYLKLRKSEEAKKALIFGIVGMLAIILLVLLLPERIMSKIPNVALPVIYMMVARELIRRHQEPQIMAHTETGGELYSFWKPIGIGLACMVPFLVVLFGMAYLFPDDLDTSAYDSRIEELSKNEEEALEIYNMLDVYTDEESAEFIRNTGLPNWQRNLVILDELDQLYGLPSDLIKQNTILRTYSDLRIQSFMLMNKALSGQTDAYDSQIMQLNAEIDKSLETLNQD